MGFRRFAKNLRVGNAVARYPYTKFTALVTVPFTGRTCSAALHVKPIRRHVREYVGVYYFRYTVEGERLHLTDESKSVREG